MLVIKRNGEIQEFNFEKIKNAVKKAFESTGRIDAPSIFYENLEHWFTLLSKETTLSVEKIQDIVETQLMYEKYFEVAKAYILYRAKHEETRKFAEKKIKFINNYIESDNTANATIDDNSNVSNHNIAVLNAEIHKEDNQKVNLKILENKLRELYPDFDYKQMNEDFNTIAYLHDSSSQIGMPYCVAVSLYPFLLNGIKDLGGLSASPKNIDSFCGMFVNCVFAIAAQYKGACLYKDQELIINGRPIKIKDFVNQFNLDNQFISDGSKWEHANILQDITVAEENKEVLISKVYRRLYNDKIYKVTTKSGLSAQTSKDHRFKVLRKGVIEEVKAEDLHLYDTVFVDKNLSYLLDTNSYEYKRNFILGMLLGDGCLTQEDRVGLSVNYDQEYYLDIFNDYSKEIFGEVLNKNKGHKCWNAQKRNKKYKDSIMSFLCGKNTFDKNIKPEYINSINECCGFLDGLLSSDGCDRNSFGIDLVNKSLIDSCKKCLDILNVSYTEGIVPEHDNKSTLYTLSFSSCSHVYFPNFCKKLNRNIDRDFYYYVSGHAKKRSTRDLNMIDSSKRGSSFYHNYHIDVITNIETFDNDDDYVYEIETSSHWYNCGGIITHNCATPGFFVCMDWFCRKEWGDDYTLRLDETYNCNSNRIKSIRKQIHQYFQQITYSINQPSAARGSQSVFWNVSIFDKPFYDTMYGDFRFPDGSPSNWETLNWLQCEYLHWLNQERLKCILTFPVVSVALIYQNGKFVDEHLYNLTCKEYSEGNSFFTYISDSADSLSSCCRLSSKIEKPQFNFTNGQLGEMTGSKNVITLNLNRIVQDFYKSNYPEWSSAWENKPMPMASWNSRFYDNLKVYLTNILDRIYKYQIAYNECLYDLFNAGLLPVYSAGFIDLKKQYLTIGINGLNQSAEYLGIKCSNNEDYKRFCNLIFSTIKEQNALHKTKKVMFNTEFTPCESAAIKLYNRDNNDGYWVPDDTNLYASYIFKPNDAEISILDKIYLHGADFCGDNLDGGSAAHLNLDSHLSEEQYHKLIKYAAEVGCKYLTFNIPNVECEDCGWIGKSPVTKCPKCNSEKLSYYDRVIGYLTKVKDWSAGRQQEFKTRTRNNSIE